MMTKIGETTSKTKRDAIESFKSNHGASFKNWKARAVGRRYRVRYTNKHGKRDVDVITAKNMTAGKKSFMSRHKESTGVQITERIPGQQIYIVSADRISHQELRAAELRRYNKRSRR